MPQVPPVEIHRVFSERHRPSCRGSFPEPVEPRHFPAGFNLEYSSGLNGRAEPGTLNGGKGRGDEIGGPSIHPSPVQPRAEGERTGELGNGAEMPGLEEFAPHRVESGNRNGEPEIRGLGAERPGEVPHLAEHPSLAEAVLAELRIDRHICGEYPCSAFSLDIEGELNEPEVAEYFSFLFADDRGNGSERISLVLMVRELPRKPAAE